MSLFQPIRGMRLKAFCVLMLLCAAHLSAQTPNSDPTLHSAVHPLISAAPQTAFYTPVYYNQNYQPPMGLLAKADKWAIYSRGINKIRTCATRGSEIWMGTDAGIKILNKSTKTMRHYTRLDGLLSGAVAAISLDQEGAWCLQADQHNEKPVVAIMRYDPSKGHWSKLHEMSHSIVAPSQPNYNYGGGFYVPGSPIQNEMISECAEKVCFVTSPTSRDTNSAALVYDRRLHIWEDIVLDPALHADNPLLNISYADIDRDGLWLGTNIGLLRYQQREKKWKRLLSDRIVYAGLHSDDGMIWMIDYQPIIIDLKMNPAGGGPQQGNIPKGKWLLTRLNPKTLITKEFSVPELGPNRNVGPNSIQQLSGISISEGKIWLTSGMLSVYNTQAPFYIFSLATEEWTSIQPQSEQQLQMIPDAALRQQTLPHSVLMIAQYPNRFADWFCREDKETDLVLNGSHQNLPAWKEKDNSFWSVDNQIRGLIRNTSRGEPIERFPITDITVPVTPQVYNTAYLNNMLFAQSDLGLFSIGPGSPAWKRVKIPRPNYSNQADYRLIPERENLWIGNSYFTLRYDPRTEQFLAGSNSQNGHHMLGVNDAGVWLKTYDQLLYHADKLSGDPIIYTPPSDPSPQYETIFPLGIAGDIAWFQKTKKTPGVGSILIGYDTKSATWTPERKLDSVELAHITCQTNGRLTYISLVQGGNISVGVLSYDQSSHQWDLVAPGDKLRQEHIPNLLLSVDDRQIWFTGQYNQGVILYDRQAKTWTNYRNETNGFWYPATENLAVRAGNVIYAGSSIGVWKFTIEDHKWQQLPGFASREIGLNNIIADEKSVWALARHNNSSQTFILRFDRSTHKWNVWTESDGFPTGEYPSQLLSDGKSAWINASGSIYRLEPETDHWRNISKQLSGDPMNASLHIYSMQFDGESVWILPSGLAALPNGNLDKAVPKPLLVRYDVAQNKFITLDPDPALKLTGNSIQVERDVVWVPTNKGVYRYEKTAQTWRKLGPPEYALQFGDLNTLYATQTNKSYWFIGQELAARWND